MRVRTLRILALATLPALLAVACGGDDDDDAGATTTETTAQESSLSGDITVFAAASLTDAFDEVGNAFKKANPNVNVTFNYEPSSGLREQIVAGAPADVYASANTSNMDQLVQAGAAENPKNFVTNLLQIVTPADNPGDVTGLDDFAK